MIPIPVGQKKGEPSNIESSKGANGEGGELNDFSTSGL